MESKYMTTTAILEDKVICQAYTAAYRIAKERLGHYFDDDKARALAAMIARDLKHELEE